MKNSQIIKKLLNLEDRTPILKWQNLIKKMENQQLDSVCFLFKPLMNYLLVRAVSCHQVKVDGVFKRHPYVKNSTLFLCEGKSCAICKSNPRQGPSKYYFFPIVDSSLNITILAMGKMRFEQLKECTRYCYSLDAVMDKDRKSCLGLFLDNSRYVRFSSQQSHDNFDNLMDKIDLAEIAKFSVKKWLKF